MSIQWHPSPWQPLTSDNISSRQDDGDGMQTIHSLHLLFSYKILENYEEFHCKTGYIHFGKFLIFEI